MIEGNTNNWGPTVARAAGTTTLLIESGRTARANFFLFATWLGSWLARTKFNAERTGRNIYSSIVWYSTVADFIHSGVADRPTGASPSENQLMVQPKAYTNQAFPFVSTLLRQDGGVLLR